MLLPRAGARGIHARGGLLPLGRDAAAAGGLQRPAQLRSRRRPLPAAAAVGPEHVDALTALSSSLSHLLTLAYEPVVLPCSALNCGDLTHRSTLDPVLRMEERGINPQLFLYASLALAYLLVKPGVLPGAIDYYVKQPLQRMQAKAYGKMDFIMGKKVASGGFGTVYIADLVEPDTKENRKVIVKKAKEFGEAEVWMNERMMRSAPAAIAEFITGFTDSEDGVHRDGDPLWLVWVYEGDFSLSDMLQKKDFPTNLEPLLFGRTLNIPDGAERKAAVLKLVMQQLLECLQAVHAAGLVHRDVKPQNIIISENSGTLKLIDFGAAADLRIGINYQPNMYLLDMRYAPPQKYIMNKYTPRAPSRPLAALLSPVLWNLFHPDRFDMYSVGITLMQMACPNLHNDDKLIAFNKVLANDFNHDLRKWRAMAEANPRLAKEFAEGLAVLDADNGAGWDLACQLVQLNPSDRLSSSEALKHRWFAPSRLDLVATEVAKTFTGPLMGRLGGLETMGRLGDMKSFADAEAGWLEQRLAPSGTQKVGGFTETQLEDLIDKERRSMDQSIDEEPEPTFSSTMAWWQGRNARMQQKLQQRRASLGRKLQELGQQAKKTVSGNGKGLSLKKLIGVGKE